MDHDVCVLFLAKFASSLHFMSMQIKLLRVKNPKKLFQEMKDSREIRNSVAEKQKKINETEEKDMKERQVEVK